MDTYKCTSCFGVFNGIGIYGSLGYGHTYCPPCALLKQQEKQQEAKNSVNSSSNKNGSQKVDTSDLQFAVNCLPYALVIGFVVTFFIARSLFFPDYSLLKIFLYGSFFIISAILGIFVIKKIGSIVGPTVSSCIMITGLLSFFIWQTFDNYVMLDAAKHAPIIGLFFAGFIAMIQTLIVAAVIKVVNYITSSN